MSDFANKLNQIKMGMPSNTMQITDIKSRKLFESGIICWQNQTHGMEISQLGKTLQFDESLVFN